MNINPFLKYVMKDKKEDIFHSSAYGKAQNAGGMGTASSVSFSQRMNIDRNRKTVRGYRDSRIVNEARGGFPKAEQYSAASDKVLNRPQGSGAGNRQTGVPPSGAPSAPRGGVPGVPRG